MKLIRWALVFCVMAGVCLAATKFRADELPPDPAEIVRFQCVANDEHGEVNEYPGAGARQQQVRWVAKAKAVYQEGHVPAEWNKTIGMTPWEPETRETKSKIGKMGTYCVEWTQEMGQRTAKARERR